jgi:carbon-monoxide dehydrogenase large subunit
MISSALDLVAGRGRFVDDDLPAGTLHAAFVRAGIPHGVLTAVDTDLAAGMPGVVAIDTAETLRANDVPGQLRPAAPATHEMARPLLARGRVRFSGEAVALVLAERPEQAVDAADSIWPDIDPLPAVIDPDRAVADETLLFPEAGTNVAVRKELGSDGPEPDGEVVVEMTIRHPRLAAVPIEPMAALAVPDGDAVTLWCGHQSPHRLLSVLDSVLPAGSSIRVRVPDVGGAFGSKGQVSAEYLAVAAAALQHQRPVLWRERRREHFAVGHHGRGMIHRVRLVGDRDGRMRGITLDIVGDLGAYPQSGFMVPNRAAGIGAGPYLPDHVRVTMTAVVTNTAPTGPYRGAGRPEAAAALERTVDVFARRIGMDPLEVRRRNLIPPDAMPFTTPTGSVYDGGDYRKALDLAADLIDVDAVRGRQAEARESGVGPLIGLGFATFVEPAGGPVSSGEFGRVDVLPDGTVVIRTGSTSTGQPHRRVWTGVVGEVFDIDPSSIEFIAGDTGEVRDGGGTFGSRSTQYGAVAVHRSALQALERAREAAGEMLGVSPDRIRVESGGFVVAGSPEQRVDLASVASRAADDGKEITAEEWYAPGANTFPYGTHAAVVAVDRETGAVEIERVVAVDDAGVLLDPEGAHGQLHGGLTQGIGQALSELLEYREDGQLLTGSLMDYAIPRASTVPPFVIGELATPAPNDLGVKGAGESGMIGLPVAILNAVVDALGGDGLDDLTLPLRPGRVWEAMRRRTGWDEAEARAGAGSG